MGKSEGINRLIVCVSVDLLGKDIAFKNLIGRIMNSVSLEMGEENRLKKNSIHTVDI